MSYIDELNQSGGEKPAINTNVRLFDLVRFMRSELHQADLITDEEYSWLCRSEMAQGPQGGSPSPRRLEDYDQLQAKCESLRVALEKLHWVAEARVENKHPDLEKALSSALHTLI